MVGIELKTHQCVLGQLGHFGERPFAALHGGVNGAIVDFEQSGIGNDWNGILTHARILGTVTLTPDRDPRQ